MKSIERSRLTWSWLVGTLALSAVCLAGEPPVPVPHVQPPAQVQEAQAQQIHAGKGGELAALPLPEPEPFKTEDGRTGWKLRIPGGRALATPAVVDGRLFVGGGFGSYEFYTLDARTGKRVWTFRTGDDGPTAAVVSEGCVAYNTESCTIYVQEAATGKLLWSRWLGDPLMSQPAIVEGRLFMAYPGNDGSHHLAAFELLTGKELWDRKIAGEIIAAPVVEGGAVFAATTDGTMYAFEAKSGRELWGNKCNVTSAPWVTGGKVYFSQRAEKTLKAAAWPGGEEKTSTVTVEGFNIADPKSGKLAFAEPQAAIKAPYLLDYGRAQVAFESNQALHYAGQTGARYLSRDAGGALKSALPSSSAAAELAGQLDAYANSAAVKDAKGGQKDAEKALDLALRVESMAADPKQVKDEKQREELRRAAQGIRGAAEKTHEAAQTAAAVEGKMGAIREEAKAAHKDDSSVGFANAPAAAKLDLAKGNIGQGGVKSVWAFQGSRPTVIGNRCYSAAGDSLRALDKDLGKGLWESKIESKDSTRPATPPAFAGDRMYLGTSDGRILCVDPGNGRTVWESKVGGRIVFQPAVADGRVYAATEDGTLICLETGDKGATGWAMWGGSAGHNGAAAK